MSVATRWRGVADATALSRQARDCVAAWAQEALREQGRFSIVLAGGNTPRALYGLLRDLDTDWAAWQVWFGDERCLPRGDAQRNSVMARAAWLDHVPLAAHQIHEIPAERGPVAGASAMMKALEAVGRFDCVLLGLGEDGHTASLFPGHEAGTGAAAPDALAVRGAPKPPPERVSLSAARLSRARHVLFLVAGQAKREAVAQWRAGAPIPARAIAQEGGVDVLVEAALL